MKRMTDVPSVRTAKEGHGRRLRPGLGLAFLLAATAGLAQVPTTWADEHAVMAWGIEGWMEQVNFIDEAPACGPPPLVEVRRWRPVGERRPKVAVLLPPEMTPDPAFGTSAWRGPGLSYDVQITSGMPVQGMPTMTRCSARLGGLPVLVITGQYAHVPGDRFLVWAHGTEARNGMTPVDGTAVYLMEAADPARVRQAWTIVRTAFGLQPLRRPPRDVPRRDDKLRFALLRDHSAGIGPNGVRRSRGDLRIRVENWSRQTAWVLQPYVTKDGRQPAGRLTWEVDGHFVPPSADLGPEAPEPTDLVELPGGFSQDFWSLPPLPPLDPGTHVLRVHYTSPDAGGLAAEARDADGVAATSTVHELVSTRIRIRVPPSAEGRP